MDDSQTFPPQFNALPSPATYPAMSPASQTPLPTDAPAIPTPLPKKRGRRRNPVATEAPQAPRQPREPRRAAPRRASTPKRPRRNAVRKPKRSKAVLDVQAMASIFVGLQAEDTAVLADVVARLNDATPAARRRVLDAVGKVFGEGS